MSLGDLQFFHIIIFAGIAAFLIFRLNQMEVSIDLIFKEIQVKLGFLTLSSFVVGLLTCLILESIYFYKRNKN